MLSPRLLHLIETHWETIATRLIRALRMNPDTPVLAGRSDLELREWCRDILEGLGELLLAPRDEAFASRFRIAGQSRFEESVPLHEAVLRLHLLREKIIGFIHEEGLSTTALDVYAEGELSERIGRFFDAMVYGLVRGYEEAMRRAARTLSSGR